MHYSLILVGAHDGTKTEALVRHAASLGQTLLIEPVPWLFEKLRRRYAGSPSIRLCNSLIAETDGEFDFFAPTESANEIQAYGDQLGSLNPTHAEQVDPRFAGKIEKIKVRAHCFETLLDKFDVSSIDTLMTDTEGYDAKILATFQFQRLKPGQVIFEYKHSDGVFNIGSNFARLLVVLETSGYRIRIADEENCVATRRN